MSYSPARPIVWILCGTILSAVSAILTFQAIGTEPGFSPLVASFVRVLGNPMWLILAFPLLEPWNVSSNKEQLTLCKELWIWGLMGSVTVATYYISLQLVGVGAASFLGSTSGVTTAILAPFFLKIKSSKKTWLAVFIALLGCLLVKSPVLGGHWAGWMCGLISGVSGGLAYFSLVFVRGRISTPQIMIYWTFFSLFTHGLLFIFLPPHLPHQMGTWFFLAIGGLCLAGGQYFVARAYTWGDPLIIGVLSYLTPVYLFLSDWFWFGQKFSGAEIFGCLCILSAGIWIVYERNFISSSIVLTKSSESLKS